MQNFDEDCLICYTPLIDNGTVRVDKCCHIFCYDCFIEISQSSTVCPLDGQAITTLTTYKGSGEEIETKEIISMMKDTILTQISINLDKHASIIDSYAKGITQLFLNIKKPSLTELGKISEDYKTAKRLLNELILRQRIHKIVNKDIDKGIFSVGILGCIYYYDKWIYNNWTVEEDFNHYINKCTDLLKNKFLDSQMKLNRKVSTDIYKMMKMLMLLYPTYSNIIVDSYSPITDACIICNSICKDGIEFSMCHHKICKDCDSICLIYTAYCPFHNQSINDESAPSTIVKQVKRELSTLMEECLIRLMILFEDLFTVSGEIWEMINSIVSSNYEEIIDEPFLEKYHQITKVFLESVFFNFQTINDCNNIILKSTIDDRKLTISASKIIEIINILSKCFMVFTTNLEIQLDYLKNCVNSKMKDKTPLSQLKPLIIVNFKKMKKLIKNRQPNNEIRRVNKLLNCSIEMWSQ